MSAVPREEIVMGTAAIAGLGAGAAALGSLALGALNFAWANAQNKPLLKDMARQYGLGSVADALPN